MGGELVLIAGGPLTVEVLPHLGARVHRIVAFGHDLLRTPPSVAAHVAEPFAWGGYLMTPWGNRLDATPTPVGDRVVRLGSNIADGSAIHGQLYDRPWDELGSGRFRARGGGDAWPWRYEAALGARVEDASLRLELAMTNVDDAPMPAGIGWHPWFRDPVEVRIPARGVYRSNLDSSPRPESVSGPYDRREPGPLALGLDATWTDLDDDTVDLTWPGIGISGSLRARAWVRGPGSGDRREDDAGRAVEVCIVAANLGMGAVAVEPQTHAPQGLRRLLTGEPNAMQLLQPGETLRLDLGLAIKPA